MNLIKPKRHKSFSKITKLLFLILISFATYAQTVSGVVKDSDDSPLAGVSVQLLNSTVGALTDSNGSYSIQANKGQTLRFSFLGFSTKELIVGGQSTINVTLEDDAASLDEVVVTGVFDWRTRMESSVAISTLNTKQLDRTAPFEFTPTQDFENPRPVNGFSSSSSTMVGPIAYTIPGSVWGRTENIEYDSRNVSQFIDRSIGLNWTHLGKGWTFNNNGKFAKKDNESNLVAVVFPFRVDQPTFYGVGANLPTTSNEDCFASGKPVSIMKVENGGHAFTVPTVTNPPAMLGNFIRDINMAKVVFDFFMEK